MIKRFKPALIGAITLLKKDINFLLHILCAVLVILTGLLLKLSAVEWMFLCIAIFTVLITEAMNTAIEYAVDLTTVEYHVWAKHAKDIAAFAVLLASILAVIIGLIIFIPKII
ncbi:diacylglycerol kinase [Staphylococcus agnetis]|nr:diacylglycerol kinase family protein [Staphylococcus agnetis]KFE42191.1 diacylglycerol kinase [Staphylococcus agnetis]NJH64884.1 diacylglycerol kinase [Staphylococcus agnetis]PTH45359.1 diacylglycerol kinase [Staphylococcus agnetis]PTH72433.1 diacylglycerol kinase [Staphylococcus agnetis]PTH73827.1 diacylglycerol kinase [Staphylococcus agnetis]